MKKAVIALAMAILLAGCGSRSIVVKPQKAAEVRRKACMAVVGYHLIWSKVHGCKEHSELQKQAQKEGHPVVYVCGRQVLVAYPDGSFEKKPIAQCR